VQLDVQAVLPSGLRVSIAQITGEAARPPAAPTIVVLEPGAVPDDCLAVVGQEMPASLVLLCNAPRLMAHPGFVFTTVRNRGLDDHDALVWLCDGREGVTPRFLDAAVEALRQRADAAFAVAVERPTQPVAHCLRAALSGTGLGGAMLFRASAARFVGGLDESAHGPATAQWDLAIRLAEAGHRWIEVTAMIADGPLTCDRVPEQAVRWLYRKHAALYRRHLRDVLVDRAAAVGQLRRSNHLSERALDYGLRPRLRARRRERDRLGRKLRRGSNNRAAANSDQACISGDFLRLEPVSACRGSDRGVPIDRYYIERFLRRHASDIRGTVLAYRDAADVRRWAESALIRCDVFDLDPTNRESTIVTDLSDPRELRSGIYDCAILIHVLNLIGDPAGAMLECRRILRPGGVLLASVPCASPVDREAPDDDRWRFSRNGFMRLVEAAFGAETIDVQAEGNRTALIAWLAGLAADEVGEAALEPCDPCAPVLITARAVKPAEGVHG
jgi:SAM-dependent methyltransferase